MKFFSWVVQILGVEDDGSKRKRLKYKRLKNFDNTAFPVSSCYVERSPVQLIYCLLRIAGIRGAKHENLSGFKEDAGLEVFRKKFG